MTQATKKDELLRKLYYDVENPSGLSSVRKLAQAASKYGISHSDVRKWLSQQITYTLHKPARRHYKRNPVVVRGIDDQWQADLVDMKYFQRHNNGNIYILTVIDCFSKYAFAVPVRTKRAKDIVEALRKILAKRVPNKLQTDQGTEFTNKHVQDLLKQHNIQFFTTSSGDVKCSIIERFNRTLRRRMFKYFTSKGTWKYVDILPKLIKTYNNSVHRSIGMKPAEVKDHHERLIFRRLYGVSSIRELLKRKHASNYKEGDTVRIQYDYQPFSKGYYPNWTDETYTIAKVVKGPKKPMFLLKDTEGKVLRGKFYPEEIQKITSGLYRVEVLGERVRHGRKELYVNWVNYPSSYNTWIPAEELVDVS